MGWSHELRSRIEAHTLSFQQVYKKLEAALQLHKKTHSAQLNNKASHFLSQSDDEIIPVKYSGKKSYSPCMRENHSNVKKFHSLTIDGCFNRKDSGN